MSEAPEAPPRDEAREVERMRFSRALAAGVDYEIAAAFAEGDGDLHRLEQLVRDGCNPNLAAQIA
jgi:hypothetical protein